jgi:hypothetical protein
MSATGISRTASLSDFQLSPSDSSTDLITTARRLSRATPCNVGRGLSQPGTAAHVSSRLVDDVLCDPGGVLPAEEKPSERAYPRAARSITRGDVFASA